MAGWQVQWCNNHKKKRGILFCRNSQPWRCSQHFPQLMSCMMSIESQMNSFQPLAWKLVRNLYWKRMACLTIVLLPKMVVIRMQRLEKRRENGRRWRRWKNLLIAGVVLRNLRRNPSVTMRVAKTSWRPCERRSSRTGDGSAWLEKSGRALKFGNQVAGGYCLNPRKRYFNGLLARCATQTDFSVRLWWLAVNRFLILWQQWWLRLSFSRVKTLKSIEETLIWFHSVFLSHLKFDDIDMINIYIYYIYIVLIPPPTRKKRKDLPTLSWFTGLDTWWLVNRNIQWGISTSRSLWCDQQWLFLWCRELSFLGAVATSVHSGAFRLLVHYNV